MNFEILANDHPTLEERLFLEDQINRFNMQITGDYEGQELCLLARQDDKIIAGIYGWTWGGGCFIDSLWVDETYRKQGLGSQLLQTAEQEANRRGCTQMILDTHDFQAPEFYKKYGYELVGRVPDYPRGHGLNLFRKVLNAS